MIYKNRKKFVGMSAALGRIFSFLPGNAWTAMGLLLTVISAYFLVNGAFLSAAVLLFLGAACDFIDGSVARYRKEASVSGAYYDTITDRYAEGIVAIALMFVPLPFLYVQPYVWAGAYLFGSLMTTYAKSAAKEKLDRDVVGGLLERPERMMLVVIGVAFAATDAVYLVHVLIVLAVLTNISALQRIFAATRAGKKAYKSD